jgi:pectate lyase
MVFLVLMLGYQPIVRADDEAPWRWKEGRMPDLGFDFDRAQVIRVTSLDSRGEGTLRAALDVEGPRIVVFDIAGVIDLEEKAIKIDHDEVVVAGQTAPSPGITLIKGGMSIGGSHVLVQHLSVRPGDAGHAKISGWEPDGIATKGDGSEIWIDHCSVTWSVDENLSATSYGAPEGGNARRIVFYRCLIAEGLNHATHREDDHSKGSLILDGTREVAIVQNFYASNMERNPLFKPDTSGVVVNNVIANPGLRSIHSSAVKADSGMELAKISVVGNLVLFGAGTKKSSAIFEGEADGYFHDNEGYDISGGVIPELRVPFETLAGPPVWPEGLEAVSPSAALWLVARQAGARPGERDPIDARIIRQSLAGEAVIIDSQDEVGGYPVMEPVLRSEPLDVPDQNRRKWLGRLAEEVERIPVSDRD